MYKRYASLYFVAGIDAQDNELIALEVQRCSQPHVLAPHLRHQTRQFACNPCSVPPTVRNDQNYAMQIIHHFVEVLDRYFGNVCELDLIFNFHKVEHAHSPPPAATWPVDTASPRIAAGAIWRQSP